MTKNQNEKRKTAKRCDEVIFILRLQLYAHLLVVAPFAGFTRLRTNLSKEYEIFSRHENLRAKVELGSLFALQLFASKAKSD